MIARYVIGIVLGLLAALVLAPLVAAPASTIVMWIGWIVVIVCGVLLALALINGDRRTRL
jgi:hypothetical protein